MSSMNNYKYVEETVNAVQSTPDTQRTILKVFGDAASKRLLSKLNFSYDANTRTYNIVFRYKSSTVDQTLSSGDYLVELNSGLCTSMPKDIFETQYVNTSIDPLIPASEQQTPAQALVAYIRQYHPTIEVTSVEDLTEDNLEKIADALVSWYDPEKDIFEIKFTDAGITDPTGLASLLMSFPKLKFIKDTTTFILNFNNGTHDDGFGYPNQFNRIALELLIGELRKISTDAVQKLRGITFIAMKQREVIPPSVTETIWEQFRTDAMAVSGIVAKDAIRRI